jgi:hypothetical protein
MCHWLSRDDKDGNVLNLATRHYGKHYHVVSLNDLGHF